MSADKPYWFPAKRYGWGWGPPATWQGWLVVLAWAIALGAGAILLRPQHHLLWWSMYLIGMIGLLVVVCYLKGEPPRWRWGDSDGDGGR